MNHISQGLISSPLVTKDLRVKAYEGYSWSMLLNYSLEPDDLPKLRMKDNLFSI